MLGSILYELTLFSEGEDRDEGETDLVWALEFLTQRDQNYLKQHPETLSLYKYYRRGQIEYIRPAQAQGECEEVRVLREALGRRAKEPVASVLAKIQRVFGGERFRDVGRVIENGGGDCFPLMQKLIVRSKSTLQYELVALGDLRHVYHAYEALSYNFDVCQWEFRNIVNFYDKGVCPVSKARLSNGTELVSTDDHTYWTLNGNRKEGFSLGQRTMGEYIRDYTDARLGRITRVMRTERCRILQAVQIPALGSVVAPRAVAYLAGIYAAEGSFDGKHTCIAQYKPVVRQKIEAALAAVGTTFRYREGFGKNGSSGAYYALHGGEANPVVDMMRRQGMDSFDKRFPQALMSCDAGTVATLLEAHGDGDAWHPREGERHNISAVYGTSSDRLVEQLRLGLLITGRPFFNYWRSDSGGAGKYPKPIWRLHEYNDQASKLASRVEDCRALPGLRYGTVRNAGPFGAARVGCIEVEGTHNFVLSDGTIVSNCDNLAPWRAAELRQKRVRASPYITGRKEGGGLIYHVIDRWPDGSSEDPSLICGMGGDSRKADRDEELAKNAERCAMIERARANGWRSKGERIARDDLDVIVERTLAGMRGGGRGFGLADADIDAAAASLRRAA